MTPLFQAQLVAAVRWLITVGMGVAIKHGASQSEAQGFAALLNPESIAAFLVGVGTLAWSAWQKHSQNTKLVVAAVTGKTDASATPAAVAAVAALPQTPASAPAARAVAYATSTPAPPVSAPLPKNP